MTIQTSTHHRWRRLAKLTLFLALLTSFFWLYPGIMDLVHQSTAGAVDASLDVTGRQITSWEASAFKYFHGRHRSGVLGEFRKRLMEEHALAIDQETMIAMQDRTSSGILPAANTLARNGWIGLYDGGFPHSVEGVERLEIDTGLRFHVLAFYQAWGDRQEHRFPWNLCHAISLLGSIPMITWEPWVTEFDQQRHDLHPLPDRQYRSLRAIADGEYDFFIEAWATDAAEYGEPLFLRFAHEMNNVARYPWSPEYGNRPEDFVDAWRHVRQIFHWAGADQVIWVWSPHAAREIEPYYPGDEWVDWVGTVCLNYGTEVHWSQWWTFEELFDNAYDFFDTTGKPVMIAEFATLTGGGEAVQWYEDAFSAITRRYPRVRMIVLFHQQLDTTVTPHPLDWSFDQSPWVKQLMMDRLGTFIMPAG